MYFISYLDVDGNYRGGLYDDLKEYYNNTFSPECEENTIIKLCVSGKTYNEKKEYLRDKAIDFSNCEKPSLSYYELMIISAFFERNGKRYGLIEEFRENAIC